MVSYKSIIWAMSSILALGSLSIYLNERSLSEERKKEKFHQSLLEHVATTADFVGNNDGVTSKEEWINVYRELHVHFDELHPQELSTSQLEEYLSKHTFYIPTWEKDKK